MRLLLYYFHQRRLQAGTACRVGYHLLQQRFEALEPFFL